MCIHNKNHLYNINILREKWSHLLRKMVHPQMMSHRIVEGTQVEGYDANGDYYYYDLLKFKHSNNRQICFKIILLLPLSFYFLILIYLQNFDIINNQKVSV